MASQSAQPRARCIDQDRLKGFTPLGALLGEQCRISGQSLYRTESKPRRIYRHTLERLQRLGAKVIHAGHSPSFGGEKLNAIIESYFSGQNVMSDVKEWFAEFQADENDPYANQNWPESGC